MDNPNEVGEVDFVLLGVKSWQVPEAAETIRPLIGSHTGVLTLQNGVEAPQQHADILGQEHVLGGVCRISAAIEAPGVIRHAGAEPGIDFGEWDNRVSNRATSLRQAFGRADIESDIVPDAHVALWMKFLFILGNLPMDTPEPRPDTINALRYGTDASFAMLAGIQLDIFTPLQNGPMTAEQIANAIGIAPTRLPLLLYALVAAGLLTEVNGKFANTPESQHFLVQDSPAYLGDMHGQLSGQWANKLKTAESLRTGIPQAHLDFSQAPQEELEVFLRGMHARGTGTAAYILAEHYDFSSATTLVDVGGGGGGLAIAFTKVCPHLQATVVDLPQVIPITQKIVDEEGATDRVTIRGANAVHGPLPGRYDVAVVQNLLQVLSSEDAQRVVQHIGAAINPGGTIYIIGFMLDDSRLSPPSAVGANLNWINIYEEGESYTEHDHRIWLSKAGFVDIERAEFFLAGGRSLIMARKQG